MTASISFWWEAMNTVEKIYWCFAIPFSALFIIQIITTFFIGDIHDGDFSGHADVSIDNDAGIDFQFLSVKNLIAFFTIFGWVGIASIRGEMSLFLTILISIVAGLLMMTIMASIMYFMGKLAENGSLDLKNAKGKTASVYLPIPANRKGTGQVQINIQGFQTLDAITDHNEPISTGSMVLVTDVMDNEILIVKPF